MTGPSKHVTWEELACKDGALYPEQWMNTRAVELTGIFEVIRSECGNNPIKILSAYRTIGYNRMIGGARNSQHCEGRALDLRPPIGWTVNRLYHLIKEISTFTKIRGIGKYPTFVHFDTRPTEHVVYWNALGQKDDTPT